MFLKHLETKTKVLCTHTREGLTKYKVVWPKDLAKRAGADRVHGAGFQVDQHGSGNIVSTCGDGRWRVAGLSARSSRLQGTSCPFMTVPPQLPRPCQPTDYPTCGLIVVDIDPLQLEVTVPMIGPSGVDAVLITDDLPELGVGVGSKVRGRGSKVRGEQNEGEGGAK